MAQFQFVITGAEIDTLKSEAGNVDFNVVADRGMSRSSSSRVLTARFGDGYEQRVRDGINIKEENFSITLNNRPAADINLIAAYLDDKAAKSFNLTITDLAGDTAVKVVVEEYNIVYVTETTHSMSFSARRVYEP